MKRTESGKCYAACELLLLNGAPSSVIQKHCFALFQTEPGLTAIKAWRKKIGVPSRSPAGQKSFPKKKFVDTYAPEERASLELHQKLSSLMRRNTFEQQEAA